MKKETLDLLKDYLDDDLKDILYGDPKKAEERMTNKSDEDWLEEAAEKHKSPLIPLFSAVKKADENPSARAENEVIDQAIRAHAFMGARMRHIMHPSERVVPIADIFKMYYVSKMGELEIENAKESTVNPIALGSSHFLKDADKVVGPLLDPQYKAAYIKHQAELMEATQETFDDAEPQLFKLGKKASKRSGFGVLLALIVWIIGGLFIWNTFGHVWNWAFDFIDRVFFPLILFFWVIPILYAVIVGFFFLWVGAEISELSCKSSDKKLKAKIEELKSDAAYSVRDTEAAKTVDAVDGKLPRDFRDYTGHWALVAVAALTDERRITDLARKADDDSTWLTRKYKKHPVEDKPYSAAISSLLYDKIPKETDVFIAYTLMCRRRELENKDANDDFINDFSGIEKDDLFIRGKMIFCLVNYALTLLKDGEKNGKKHPGFASMLQRLHTEHPYLKLDNDNFSRINTHLRGSRSLIDWHLGK